jgi:hypothetical protein
MISRVKEDEYGESSEKSEKKERKDLSFIFTSIFLSFRSIFLDFLLLLYISFIHSRFFSRFDFVFISLFFFSIKFIA